MGLAFSYEMRERARAARQWFDSNRRIAVIGAVGALVAVVWASVYVHPFRTREMVILYRPSPDGSSVVFNLGDEYKLRTVRLLAVDDAGDAGETLWRYRVPGDAPAVSTFSLPPRLQSEDPMPPIEPGKTYRLRVSAAGASGQADFEVTPRTRRQPG